MLKNLLGGPFLKKDTQEFEDSESTGSSVSDSEIDTDDLLSYAKNVMRKNKNQTHAVVESNSLPLMKTWALNRHIDQKEVNGLKEVFITDIQELGFPRLFDPIHLCHFTDDSGEHIYEIIDGQHRYKALLEIHEDQDLNFDNFEIYVEIHEVSNEEEKMDLFDKINRRKQINRKDLIDYKIPTFIDQFEQSWVKKYKTKIYGKNRPFIDRSLLEKKLKQFSEKLEKYNVEELIALFCQLNKDISKNPRCRQHGTSSRPSTETFYKAKDKNFYLGLDRNLGWMEKII